MIVPESLLLGYVERFNAADVERYHNAYPNADAYDFLRERIPLLHCPDAEMELTYYFRWWTYRKHVRHTEDGWVVTEFLPEVQHAQKHNVISCPGGHQVREGRWLRDTVIVPQYMRFLLKLLLSLDKRYYSYWAADSAWAYSQVHFNRDWLADTLTELEQYFDRLRQYRAPGSQLYAYSDMLDGMENTAGGRAILKTPEIPFQVEAVRPTFSSYMYGDAIALAKIKVALERPDAEDYLAEAANLRDVFQDRLWNAKLKFFTCLPKDFTAADSPIDVREQIGFIPWYFHLPEPGRGFEEAWRQLTDPEGFRAPFGPTTCEQRHPYFLIEYEKGTHCQWCGPSWPFATSQTLTALANLLNDYEQDVIGKQEYFDTLLTYTRSHRFRERTPTG